MSSTYDRYILMIICCVQFYISFSTDYSILYFLIALSLYCLSTYHENKWVRFCIFTSYIILCCFCKEMLCFLPAIIYEPVRYPYRYLAFLLGIPIFIYRNTMTLYSIYTLGINTAIAIHLSLKTESATKLQQEYNTLRNSSYELSLLQEETKRQVLENQDYEINLATLNERNRISKEIHDNIGHLLSRSLLQIGALRTITKDDMTKEVLTELNDSISHGMDEIRESIHNMHDESIDLYTKVYKLTKDFTFCHIEFDYDISTQPDLKLKYCLIATVKESLNNIVKHSNATKVSLILREQPGLYQLIIKDNGTISSENRHKIKQILSETEYSESMGLQNISDRVTGFHGTVRFQFDHGFQTYLTIPKQTTS